MTRDLQEIKRGLAQAREALNLLERFIAEYEARVVNMLPCEDVAFYRASDDDVISGAGIGPLTTITETLRGTADRMAETQ
jgi:hypothetical protein